MSAFAFLFLNINSVNANENLILLQEITFDYKSTVNNIELNDKYNIDYIYIENLPNRAQIGLYENTGHGHDEVFPYFSYELFDENGYYKLPRTINFNILKIKSTGYGNDDTVNIRLYSIPKPYEFNINNLNYDINNDEITFNYELPDDDNFSHLELHQDGLLLADNITTNYFEIYNLEYDTKYNFTFYAVDNNSNKSIGISREISLPSDPNLIPSNNIFGLTHSVSDTNVSFNYSLPLDNNFSHLKIYRNNELITDNYQLSEFIDTGLEPETEYNYRFVSVNKMDISNVGYAITIKTMEEDDTVPPAVPTGLNTTNMNSGIVLSWNTNTESDLQGYNVYMNGTKMNSKPITNTIYNITNLENGLDYSFTISAVDTFGNESEQSNNVVGVPDVDNLPIFKLDTKLSSIGSSVENWFSEIWLIVAFATAIPLSFAIASRVKGLFIA